MAGEEQTNIPPSPTARDLPDITDIAATSPKVPTCTPEIAQASQGHDHSQRIRQCIDNE